jgi:hypothetical protein
VEQDKGSDILSKHHTFAMICTQKAISAFRNHALAADVNDMQFQIVLQLKFFQA